MISREELRRSSFLQAVSQLEVEPDINRMTSFFSYEHFYVIYCKFWELDLDRDLTIDRSDLARQDTEDAIALVECAFEGLPRGRAGLGDMAVVAKACGCPLYWKAPLFYAAGGERTGSVSVHMFVAMWRKVLLTCHDDAARFVRLLGHPGCSGLIQEDFVPFLQDVVNSHPGLAFLRAAKDFHSRYITTVIQRISMFELEFFYEEQAQRMAARGVEPLPFHDLARQVLDLVAPRCPGRITLRDLKQCGLAGEFFDAFFNVDKYLAREQREQAGTPQDTDSDPAASAWDRYAAEEYDFLVAEEAMAEDDDDHDEGSDPIDLYGLADEDCDDLEPL